MEVIFHNHFHPKKKNKKSESLFICLWKRNMRVQIEKKKKKK